MSISPTQSSHWLRQIAILLTCLAIFAVHIWLAWKKCDWSLINRSGALVAVVAVLSESWEILRTPHIDSMSFWGSQAGHTAVRVSIVIICFGTLVQGYGDYLSALLPVCPK